MLNAAQQSGNYDGDHDLLSETNLDETADNQPAPSTIYQVTSSATTILKNGFVITATIVGGCATVATVAPYAFNVVACYLIPSAAITGVMANTVKDSLTVASYGLGSKVAAVGAEKITNASSAAITYLFKATTKTHQTVANIENNSLKLKTV